MHLADAFIQSDLHSSYSFYISTSLAFPGNRTHDLGVASAMLYQLSYRKAVFVLTDTWGLFQKTSLPNKPGLSQLGWFIFNQINWQ